MKIKRTSKVTNSNTHNKKNFNKEKYITVKSNNSSPIRVLYKKTGQAPEVKIIDNVLRLKKAIVKKNLDIIKYETIYIICTNKKKQDKTKNPNIILDFYNITGDLILIAIDKNKREFKGLSQEDIIWYTQSLMNKTINNILPAKKISKRVFNEFNERDFVRSMDTNNNLTDFEKKLIVVLNNIELTLATLFRKQEKQ